MRLSDLAAVLTATLVTLLGGSVAHAAGKDIITHSDVVIDSIRKDIRLPIKRATREVVTAEYRRIPRIGAGRALARSLGIGGVAALVVLDLADQYYGPEGDNVPTIINNEIYLGERYPGTFYAVELQGATGGGWRSQYTGQNGLCGGLTFSEAATCARAAVEEHGSADPTRWVKWGNITRPNGDYRLNGTWMSEDGVPGSAASAVLRQMSANYPSGYSPKTVTQDQMGDWALGSSDPNALKDLFRNPDGSLGDEVDQAPSEPHPLSEDQLNQINEAIRSGLDAATDALAKELAKFGREHGVRGAADPKTVDEVTSNADKDGDGKGDNPNPNRIIVQVNVPTDKPGGTFTEPELEELSSWQELTQEFYDSVQAAPIVEAWSRISASVPTGSCPTANIVAFGNSYSLSEPACVLWETHVVPILSLVFLFVWPFIGLRIVMSS